MIASACRCLFPIHFKSCARNGVDSVGRMIPVKEASLGNGFGCEHDFQILKMTTEYSNFEYSTLEYTVASMKRPRLTDIAEANTYREAHLTQHQIAKKIGQTQSYVSKYEHGEQRLNLIELEAVCDAAGVSLSEFVRRYLES